MAQTAVVSGAGGYISLEIISQLLHKGYNVRGTVRSRAKAESKYATLYKLADALPGTLELYEADLVTPNAFDEVTQGADYVFHVASPVTFEAEDNQRDIVDPAVSGALSMLGSVAKAKSVKRVVLTSSVVAVFAALNENVQPPKNGKAYTEEDWNTVSSLPDQAYHVSKVKAERAAWDFAREHGIDLVTILPSQVLGPVLDTTTPFSVAWQKSLLETGTVPGQFGMQVDVRDVARAHILAAEIPTASGRYIVSHPGAPNLSEAVGWLQERFPQYDLKAAMPDSQGKFPVDNAKAAKELGLTFIPLRESYIDGAVTIVQKGIAKPPVKEAAA